MKTFDFYKLLDTQASYLYVPTITDYVLILTNYQFTIFIDSE